MYFVFLLLWVVFNGRVTAEILAVGAVLSAAFQWFVCRYLGRTLEDEKKTLRRLPQLAKYVLVLLYEIFKANFDVIRLILSPSQEVEPQLVEVRTDLRENSLRAMLANSITLTPGTITVRIMSGYLQVHCLDRSLAEGLDDSSFLRLLRRMEATK